MKYRTRIYHGESPKALIGNNAKANRFSILRNYSIELSNDTENSGGDRRDTAALRIASFTLSELGRREGESPPEDLCETIPVCPAATFRDFVD